MFESKRTEKLKKERGITLIALIITIIILVILAAVSINAAYNSGIINYSVNGTENYIRAADREKGAIENAEAVLEDALLSVNPFVQNKGVNTPKITEGMIPIRWDEVKVKWVVCARDDERWYNYTEEKMEWANMMLSDGTYKAGTVQVGQEVNESDLGSMFVWIPRYAYSMTHYKMPFEGTADENNGTTQNITNVVFLKGTTNEGADGIKYGRDYNADSQTVGEETEKIVHPAFTFGGKELTGIWVAKFEASMAETNANTATENNAKALEKTLKILPNAESWRYINIGKAFKVCLNMKNENNPYGIKASTNTHLMKNSEWGAVAYLAASQYGIVPTMNESGIDGNYTEDGKSKRHAYTAGSSTSRDYIINKLQSTTGTENGVYDLNGGSFEYVAAYWDNEYSGLSNYGGSDMFPSSGGYKLNSTYSAYWDKYDVYSNPAYAEQGDIDGSYGYSSKSNELLATAAYERMQLMKSKKGDAIYEVLNTYKYYGWDTTNSKYVWLIADYGEEISTDDPEEENVLRNYGEDTIQIGIRIQPFTARGGNWTNSTASGIFFLYAASGDQGPVASFRPAITQ